MTFVDLDAPTPSSIGAQPSDGLLSAISALTTAADQLIYAIGADQVALTAFTAFARSLVAATDAAAARSGLELGTMAVQNANNVNISGGTIGGTNIEGGVVPVVGGNARLTNGVQVLAAAAGAYHIFADPSGLNRWIILQTLGSEDLRIDRYDSAGAYVQSMLWFTRAGAVAANGPWTFGNLSTFNSGINAATIGNAATINASTALAVNANTTDFGFTVNNFVGADFNRKGLKVRIGNNNIDSTFLQVVGAANGNACNFSANVNGVVLDRRFQAAIFRSSSYTVATLPSATSNASDFVYCSNLIGGAEYVFSDGTNWRRVSDRSIAN